MTAQILVVDDELYMRDTIAHILMDEGYRVMTAGDGAEALKEIEKTAFDVVLTDLRMPGEINGMKLLEMIKQREFETKTIMMTAYSSVETAVDAMRFGAFDYIQKPFQPVELKVRIQRAVESIRRQRVAESQLEEVDQRYTLIGLSPAMDEIRRSIKEISQTDFPVLITGESGTGKELVARQIHLQSRRREQPFVALNVSTMNGNLVESELFGHEKGAFTGAVNRRIGKFELATDGSLFLDEIGDLDLEMQTKFLRVLQEKEFHRVGGNQLIVTNTRIIAATLQDLSTMIQENRFREDLFYRLNVYPIHMPPLRRRKEDIPLLLEHIVRKHEGQIPQPVERVEPGVVDRLCAYNWPGNVREFENVIIRMLIRTRDGVLRAEQIPADIGGTGFMLQEGDKETLEQLTDRWLDKVMQTGKNKPLMQFIESLIAQRFFMLHGEKQRAADLLGISKPTYFKWLKREL